MFLRILKNDLRHKKVTNFILLLFIALAAMFVSSSVNNIYTIVTAQDDYFDKAGMQDYFVLVRGNSVGDRLDLAIRRSDSVDSYIREDLMFITQDNIGGTGGAGDEIPDTIMLVKAEGAGLTYFGSDDRPLAKVGRGEMYVPGKVLKYSGFDIGSKIKITIGDTSADVTVKGTVKDAIFGSQFVGGCRFILSEEDFDRLFADERCGPQRGSMYNITSGDTDRLAARINETDALIVMQASKSLLKMSNVLDIIIAVMFLVVSVSLIIISFVVLRFTIKFTFDQEFREIGVMKAIGIPDRTTGRLYLLKYIFLSALGAACGFFAGIPFGNMLIKNSAVNMIIDSRNPYGINLACALLVMLLVVLFCGRCVRNVRKYTPVDAVRSGNTGETYSAGSKLSLSRARLKPAAFLASNDILTNIRTFAVMALTFTISLMIIIIVVDTGNTLQSGRTATMMSFAESDLYVGKNDGDLLLYMTDDGRQRLEDKIDEIGRTLEENGMDADVFVETGFYLKFKNGDRQYTSFSNQGVGTHADDYVYLEGTPPRRANEIAMTPNVADALGARIGDTVTLIDIDGEHEMMITALFQSMMNMGVSVRLHEDFDISYRQASGVYAFQIRFKDGPDKKEIAERIERVAELFPDYEVLDGGQYIDKFIGVAEILKKVQIVILPVLLLVCMLVTLLMERSMIAREKGEIAMLKASGFSDGFVIRWHMIRVFIVMLASALIAVPLSTPAAQITSGIAFRIMGARSISFEVDPLQVFLIYPALMLAANLLAILITAQTTRKITANQTADIE